MARSDLLSSHGRFNHRGIPTGLEPLPIPTLVRILLILAIAALTLAFVVAFVELLALMAGALLILAGAVFLAYAIAPIVAWLRRRLPGIAAIGITYLALLAILAALFFVIIPPLTAQAQQLISSIPSIAQSTQRAIVESGILARLPAALQNYIAALPAELAKGLTSYGPAIAQRGLGVVASVVSIAASLIVVPVLAAYLIFDATDLKRAVLGFVPARHRSEAIALIADLNDVLGGFIRGQIIDGIIVGTLIGTMLGFNHVPYALLIGFVSALLNFVPYLSILAIIPSVLLSFAYNGWQDALVVAVLFGVIQQIDGNFIEPFVMRANVALSPMVLIVAIIAFTALFGPFGAFIAVPITAMLRVVKLHFAPAPLSQDLVTDEACAADLRRFRL
jgi:predicted PurR-regulated permease PerM